MRQLFFYIVLGCCIPFSSIMSQHTAETKVQDTTMLDFKEYLGYVKKYHPVTKQAELVLSQGEANLMKARGGFDPKIKVDYDRKKFEGKEYYDLLYSTFKIPTWFGVEFQASFEQNDGQFLNAQNDVPLEGLFGAGVSVPIAQGLLINERMASLRQAKLFREQTKADRDLLVNEVLYNASLAYFDWLKNYNEFEIYRNFLQNAQIRFEGIRQSALAGDKATIDTVESRITVQKRRLELEQARVKYVNSTLALSNFLWIGNNIPVELQPNVIPNQDLEESINSTLQISSLSVEDFVLTNHPKLRSLDFKIKSLEVERRLKLNKLLPKINLEYNFITPEPEIARNFNTAEYKAGVSFSFPLFLRKERGDLKLAKFKVQDTEYELEVTQVQIQNKVEGIYAELESFRTQNVLIEDIVRDSQTMLNAEVRKFSFGESSVFLINSRENKLIDAQLKNNEVQNKYYKAKAKLFNSLALNPDSL